MARIHPWLCRDSRASVPLSPAGCLKETITVAAYLPGAISDHPRIIGCARYGTRCLRDRSLASKYRAEAQVAFTSTKPARGPPVSPTARFMQHAVANGISAAVNKVDKIAPDQTLASVGCVAYGSRPQCNERPPFSARMSLLSPRSTSSDRCGASFVLQPRPLRENRRDREFLCIFLTRLPATLSTLPAVPLGAIVLYFTG
jgi:hypothetical protein